MRVISAVWLEITTLCNRRCPECCCGMHTRPYVSYDWDYFQYLAQFIHGIHHVHITGGEPTAHPHFAEFVPRFKELFGCKELSIFTNGYRVREYGDVMRYFDFIWATRYGAENAAEVDFLVENYGATFWEGPHEPRTKRGSGLPCERGLTHPGAAYAGGRFFPCCVGPGIPGAASIEPRFDWIERIMEVPMPCDRCWFSPE